MNKKKIINDPIYGFITIPHDILFDCIELPEFQRLRRIKQLGLTHYVYPGALHTRFHHALGAMHLMKIALESLQSKGVSISVEEEKAVLLAILLHDIGHGPFSHTLENSIFIGVTHEHLSSRLMQIINEKMNGQLDLAIEIFENRYSRQFFHQLVSSQLDMDRLDYLRRDSFYTGVSEGMVGIERLIQMLNVKNDELIIDQKGIYSVEKFLMARRFMYWQVYLHKASLAADRMLLNILRRAKEISQNGQKIFASPFLEYFLKNSFKQDDITQQEVIDNFCLLDDNDIVSAIKVWTKCNDQILSTLCKMLINRNLFKISIHNRPIEESEFKLELDLVMSKYNLTEEQAKYFVVKDTIANTAYSSTGAALKIGYKDGSLVDIDETSEVYNLKDHRVPQVKYFICSAK